MSAGKEGYYEFLTVSLFNENVKKNSIIMFG